jgi:hypothetical protein
MLIEVTITNPLTSRLMMFALAVPDTMTDEQMKNLHTQFAQFNPDCHVNFEGKGVTPIYSMPLNMKADQTRLPFTAFLAKWYVKTNYTTMKDRTVRDADGTDNSIVSNIFEQIQMN